MVVTSKKVIRIVIRVNARKECAFDREWRKNVGRLTTPESKIKIDEVTAAKRDPPGSFEWYCMLRCNQRVKVVAE